MKAVAIYKPKYWGNIYSILRTADGLGFDRVYVIDRIAPIMKKGIQKMEAAKAPWNKLKFLKNLDEFLAETHKMSKVCMELDEKAVPIGQYCWNEDSVIILGNENTGLPREILDVSDVVELPMKGKTACMNVACAGSIAMYDYATKTNGD